jgi:hypothetical protein
MPRPRKLAATVVAGMAKAAVAMVRLIGWQEMVVVVVVKEVVGWEGMVM